MLKSSSNAYNNIRGDVMINVLNAVIRPCVDTVGYWAKCDTPNGGCTAQGITLKETQKNMLEAIEFYLEDYPDISDYVLLFEVHNA